MGSAHDDALGLEDLQRLAHRKPADLQLAREINLAASTEAQVTYLDSDHRGNPAAARFSRL